MTLRGDWFRHATVIGAFSCAMITLALIVPWYGANFDFWSGDDLDYRVEYSAGIGVEYPPEDYLMGDLMSKVTTILGMSLITCVIATVLSSHRRRVSGAVAAMLSTGFLLASAIIFHHGAIDELSLWTFEGYTLLNRSWSVTTEAMLGWWIALTAPIAPGVQAVILTLSYPREHANGESSVAPEEGHGGGKTKEV